MEQLGSGALRVWAVVVAAGGGTRFGGRKQFAMIRGRPMVDWALSAAKNAVDGVVLVVPPSDANLSVGDANRLRDDTRGADFVVVGGETRSASVRAGLGVVPQDAAVIVVHDGARPLASQALFARVIGAVVDGADAAVPGLAAADTLKRVSEGVVVEDIARDEVVAVQTPQAFRAEVLRRAYSAAGDATDDAVLVAALGVTVRVVSGEPRNLKVTTPADLELVQALAGT
ncbi:MAG: 2-C-methyl-D-erythritol 4-phosphate cytidylyltransferase [Acidimicrobiales bacterium]